MAFDATKLVKVAGADQQLFLYNAGADTIATVTASGYFSSVVDNFRPGDIIMTVANANATFDNIYVTSAKGATPVTTSGVEGITAT